MSTITEGRHRAEFLRSELPGYQSRDVGTLKSGENLPAGRILGKITEGTTASSAAKAGGNTGNGAMGTVTPTDAAAGIYKLRITKAASNAGDFEVIDPQGDVLGLGTVAVAFNTAGLAFTLADGGTDFVVGDGFDITVATGSQKFVELDVAATDGSQHAAGVLYDNVDATGGDTDAVVIVRGAEIKLAASATDLGASYPTGLTDPQKATVVAELTALGILVRAG